eukprot:6195134-Pleurochrysis_carterae.AAC.2
MCTRRAIADADARKRVPRSFVSTLGIVGVVDYAGLKRRPVHKIKACNRKGDSCLETGRLDEGSTATVARSPFSAKCARCTERPDECLLEWASVELAGLRTEEVGHAVCARRKHVIFGVAVAYELTQARGQQRARTVAAKHNEVVSLA